MATLALLSAAPRAPDVEMEPATGPEPSRKRARAAPACAVHDAGAARRARLLEGRRRSFVNARCTCLLSLFDDIFLVQNVLSLLTLAEAAGTATVSRRWMTLAASPPLYRSLSLAGAGGRADALAALLRRAQGGATALAARSSKLQPAEAAALASRPRLLRSLRSLDLSGAHLLDDEAVAPLLAAAPALEQVRLGGTAVSDATLGALAGLKRLREVVLTGCRSVTGGAVAALAAAMGARLRVLGASHGPRFAAADLVAVARAAPGLRVLRVAGSNRLTDEVLFALAAHASSLEVLDVSAGNPFGGNRGITAAGVEALRSSCGDLRVVEARGVPL